MTRLPRRSIYDEAGSPRILSDKRPISCCPFQTTAFAAIFGIRCICSHLLLSAWLGIKKLLRKGGGRSRRHTQACRHRAQRLRLLRSYGRELLQTSQARRSIHKSSRAQPHFRVMGFTRPQRPCAPLLHRPEGFGEFPRHAAFGALLAAKQATLRKPGQ